MSNLLLSEETVETALRLITALAESTLPDTIGAGVSLIDAQGRKTSAASSDALVEEADRLQYELNEGPCLTAWAQRAVVRVDDVALEQRWVRWSEAVQSLPVRSVLSAPLLAEDVLLGAIKVYGQRPDAYDEHSEQVLAMFGTQAGILMANVKTLEDARKLTEQLKDALRTRDAISTAKGILIAREHLDEDGAFARLVSLSQREGKKLREVAETLVQAATRRKR
ncbi:ANTAR domain-containing protein [Kineococcus sp. NUM-3379]